MMKVFKLASLLLVALLPLAALGGAPQPLVADTGPKVDSGAKIDKPRPIPLIPSVDADDNVEPAVVDVDSVAISEEEETEEDRQLRSGYNWYYSYFNYFNYANYYYGGWQSYWSNSWYSYSAYTGWYNNYYANWYSTWYDFYDFYSFYTGGWYQFYGSYGWYDAWYDFYGGWYGTYYGAYGAWYNSWYDFYDWYVGYYYNAYGYANWYWYNWYSWGYYGNHRIGQVHPYSYYYRQTETFTPGYSYYQYYYWYHYADSTSHWEAKLKLGWTNWADVTQGAFVSQASSFLRTWKCHAENAYFNILEMSQLRRDSCSNGDRRFIFATDDAEQALVVDLGKERQINEIGVDFGSATSRLPEAVKFSYLPVASSANQPVDYHDFGEVTVSQHGGYAKSLSQNSVTTRYIKWVFERNAESQDGDAFMQVVAAGPAYQVEPSTPYVVLVVILVIAIIAVFIIGYFLLQSRAGRTRRYYSASKKQLAKENAEFSSDEDSSDSDSDSDSDSSDSDEFDLKVEV